MRTLRLTLAATLVLVLLGGLTATAVARTDGSTKVTGTVVSVASNPSNFEFSETGVIGEDYIGHGRGTNPRVDFEWSDPRLPSRAEMVGNFEYYGSEADGDVGAQVTINMWLLEDSDGYWSGPWTGWSDDQDRWRGTVVLTGHGAYEGLYAVLTERPQEEPDGTVTKVLEGAILAGEMPPPPEPLEPTSEPAEEPGEATAADTVGEPADDGARIIEVERLDDRMVDLTIDSPAVGTQQVRLLLPADFDPDADSDWPVLYLLHGAMDDYTSWTRETDVADLTAELDLLVVMPEAGEWGFYSDWWNGGEGGPPMWETFHLTEVRELLERNWQAGDDRVVAGLSMGGFGAMSYAARHPGFFKAAASFSGVLNPIAPGFDVAYDLWGSRAAQAEIWEAHDPVSLAPALEGTALYVSYGEGGFGPLDEVEDQESSAIEEWLAGHNEAFVARLEELGIPATVDAYGPGTHAWAYWERGLHDAMPMLMEALGT